jgi:hypothetical protein
LHDSRRSTLDINANSRGSRSPGQRHDETNRVSIAWALLLLSALWFAPTLHAATAVEVTLVNKLDEPRGFCLDIPGFQARARPEQGLHTHSCYSYQGKLAVDQAFDAGMIAGGAFRIIAFDRCMTAPSMTAGSRLALEACDGRAAQQFQHRATGQIVALAAPEYCVTAGAGPSRHGGGGNPVHLIRDLTLEACDSSRDDRQRWRLRESYD